MARRAALTGPRFDHAAEAVFHDHLEGSAHCVECGGPCTITDPTQAALTSIVRAMFEAESLGWKPDPIPFRIVRALEEHGVKVKKMRQHAREVAAHRP